MIPMIGWIMCSITSMLVGSILASEYCRKVMWNQSLQVESQAALIKKFQEAAKPIIEEIEAAGEDTYWKDGPETDRVYPYYELEPLAKVLKESQNVR